MIDMTCKHCNRSGMILTERLHIPAAGGCEAVRKDKLKCPACGFRDHRFLQGQALPGKVFQGGK